MMSEGGSQTPMWSYQVNLDKRVREDHPLRRGKEVFVSLFSRVVQQCVEAGLVEGRKIHVDASLVDADANLGSVKPLSEAMIKAIEQTASCSALNTKAAK
jgi:hypothetical protein